MQETVSSPTLKAELEQIQRIARKFRQPNVSCEVQIAEHIAEYFAEYIAN